MSRGEVFREQQHMRQWWLWVILLLITGLSWYFFIGQILLDRPVGDRPAPDWAVWLIFLLFGIVMPLFFLATRLVTVVTQELLDVHFRFLSRRRIPLSSIASASAVRYRPLLEYGGWGIRWSPGRGWAYNAHGDRGVRLKFRDGKQLLVGSQDPDALAAALGKGGVVVQREDGP